METRSGATAAPGLYRLKPWYSQRLAGVCAAAVRHRVGPDVFTAAGVVAAAAAGGAIAAGWWPVALAALALRLAGANLDGLVARARGVARPWGAVLNELGDRAGDLLMFAGLALLAARTGDALPWVLVAAVAATLPTFVALAAAGAGATRSNGGPVGKTERCLLAVVATALPAVMLPVAALVIAGSVATAGVRLAAAYRELAR
jgi:CDP-diacylglycerol--glycerol-3-phosphate 3-phosphatidyltransferase